MGSSVGTMGSCQLCSYTRVQAICSRTVHSAIHGLNQLEFAYRDPGYAAQFVELSKLWTEPQRAEIAQHGYDLALGYLEWKAIRVKDVMLSARDDFVQPANPLPERIPMEIEILRREFEVER